jgi:hypothetical protein
MTAAARIEEAFAALNTVDFKGEPVQALHIPVPYCDYKGRAKTTTLYEVIEELLGDFQKPVAEAMFKVLQESDGPHVQALRSVMCSQWVRSHADELEAAYDLEAAL